MRPRNRPRRLCRVDTTGRRNRGETRAQVEGNHRLSQHVVTKPSNVPSGAPAPGASLRVVVASTFTAEPIRPTLELWASRFGWRLAIEFEAFDQAVQSLLDPTSATGRNARGVNVVLARWSDLGAAHDGSRAVEELSAALEASAARTGAPHLVVLARDPAFASLDRVLGARLQHVSGVHVLDAARTDRLYPVSDWRDAAGDASARVPYTPDYFAALGTVVARAVRALIEAAPKVIVLDCDNTLWGGACGEDGAAGVSLTEPYLALQRFMSAQSNAGRLICLASKNVEADVREVFATRPMELAWDAITAHRIDWNAKSANLRSLAAALDLSLDSFVFVDDNAVECAQVASELPEVLTLQLPANAERIPAYLDHVWAFDVLGVTEEDRARRGMYAEAARRDEARRGATTLADFIASLELHIDIARVDSADVARASQLTQRTTQFNTRPEPLSVADIQSRGSSAALLHRVALRDRFGDYGTVGLLCGALSADTLHVDSFLLSCRALGRGVEHRMLAFVGETAASLGAARVRIPYATTARNEPVRAFLAAVGTPVATADGGVLELAAADAAAVRFRPDEGGHPENVAAKSDRVRATTARASNDVLSAIPHELARIADIVAATRPALRERPHLQQGYEEPRAGTERRIARIWGEELGIDGIGALDRFVDLGGTSLDVVRVHSRLASEMGVAIDITELFRHPTVRALARSLDGTDRDVVAGAVARAARQRAALGAARTTSTNGRGR